MTETDVIILTPRWHRDGADLRRGHVFAASAQIGLNVIKAKTTDFIIRWESLICFTANYLERPGAKFQLKIE